MIKNLPLRSLLGGLSSYTPLLDWRSRYQRRGTGGTDSARYCYSVWLRHLVVLYESGLQELPASVAELGPGDSIGIGLAALLCGCDHYHALDVIEYSSLEKNLKVLDELVDLFHRRESIPDDSEFPKVHPKLESYAFPQWLLADDVLRSSLSSSRLDAIRAAITGRRHGGSVSIRYSAPWLEASPPPEGSVGLIYSQAVLEHVDDLQATYHSMYKWLAKGGIMSHQVDFKSHGITKQWNGHWGIPDPLWGLIRGKRPYLLNREPCSAHLALLSRAGFQVVRTIRVSGEGEAEPGIGREELAGRFRGISEEDLSTSVGHFISVKRQEAPRGAS